MVDVWQSDWFSGMSGQKCRIVYEEKGSTLHELLEYEDQRREKFQWQGSLIYGFNFTRLGNRCIQVPEGVFQDVMAFFNGLSKGTMVIRNGTKVWKK